MPKQVTQQEFDEVVQAITRLADGRSVDAAVAVSVDAIGRSLITNVSRRTLQRRLAMLVEQGRLAVTGRGRGSGYRLPRYASAAATGAPPTNYAQAPTPPYVYQPPAGSMTVSGGGSPTVNVEKYIPVSPEAERIKQAIRQPLHQRQPAGYNREFLDAYRPNETFYLPAPTRQRLFELGRSPNAPRPAGTYARQIFNRLLIDLSWNSSRLEGNTYSLLETERLLEIGESADGKDTREAQMILNHKAAIELLVEQANEVDFNRYTIQNLHALLSDNLLDAKACGRVREIAVGIDGTVFHPLAVPQLIEECFQQILDTAAAIRDPFEQAFFAMVQLPYLQPFEDVNKRVSRLAANLPFIRGNLCPLSFVDVPDRAYVDGILGVYELNSVDLLRDVFVWAYERSCARYSAVARSLGEPDPFRLRYRTLIAQAVSEIVGGAMDKKTAVTTIRQRAANDLPKDDQARFAEVVETELMSLHEGNIARYRVRPSQYLKWQQTWR
jgi:Fic/DOC family